MEDVFFVCFVRKQEQKNVIFFFFSLKANDVVPTKLNTEGM